MTDDSDLQKLILGSEPDSFRSVFEQSWHAHISCFPKRFQTAIQLRIGSRFRPHLVAWGHLLAGGLFDFANRFELANLALYVELLHKATILIDDLIDGDSARHGEPAFHVEFGDHEAILFAIYLLGDCVDSLSKSTNGLRVEGQHSSIVELLGKAIRDMALGGIEESSLSADEISSISKIKRIIELQTITLVKNGLLVGFYFGGGAPSSVSKIDSLGYDAGHMFQVLNDLEPFYGANQNAKYKGGKNSDLARLRKNYVIATLMNRQSTEKRDELIGSIVSEPDQAYSILESELRAHKVLESIRDNLRLVKVNIDRTVGELDVRQDRREGFSSFVNYILDKALSRLDKTPRQKLSEILIT